MSFQGGATKYPFNFPYRYILNEEDVVTNENYTIKSYKVKLNSKEELTIVSTILLNNQLHMTKNTKSKIIHLARQKCEGGIVKQKSSIDKISGYEYYYLKCRTGNIITETNAIFPRDRHLMVVRKYILGTKLVFNLDSIYYRR